jgi:hypothetical protein
MNIELQAKRTQDPREIKDELIALLGKAFPYVRERSSFNSYFFSKYLEPPIVNWLEYEGRPVAHYSLFQYEFFDGEKLVKAGKPELNLVSPELIGLCLKQKLNYAELDPMGRLNTLLLAEAKAAEHKFLFTWPNEISINTYRKNGYVFRPLELALYRRFDDPGFIAKKSGNILLRLGFAFLKTVMGFFNVLRFSDKLELQEVSSITKEKYDIEKEWRAYNAAAGSSFYYRKSNELINKKFGESCFKKYLILAQRRPIGYLVLKEERDEGYFKLVDRQCADNVFYLAIAKLPEKNILYRAYRPQSKLLMFLAGFCFYRNLRRELGLLDLSGELADKLNKMPVDDILSDFSV